MKGIKKGIVAVFVIVLGFTGCNINNDNEIENGDNVKTQVEDDIEDSRFKVETDKITVLKWQDDALQDNELEVICNIEDKGLIVKIIKTLTSEEWEEVPFEEEIPAVPKYYISFNNGTMIKLLDDIAYGDIVDYTINDGLYDYFNGSTYYFPEEFLTLIVDEVNKEINIADDIETEVSERLIKDNIHELNNAILTEIVRSYFLVFDFESSFYEQDVTDYKVALKYMMSAGTYPIKTFEYWILFDEYYDLDTATYTIPVSVVEQLISNDEIDSSWFASLSIIDAMYIVKPSDSFMSWSMRPEIYQYFDNDTEMITVPANIVNEYISSKFNTVVDYSQIEDYSENSDTYSYYPFMGEFYYDILIGEVIVDAEIVIFTCILTDNIEENPTSEHQATFIMQFVNGEYKILSVEVEELNLLSIN